MLTWTLLGLAGFAAGVINAVAGGGSLLSFPALLLTGMPAVAANATNTIAIWPGSVSSVWSYRAQLGEERHRALVLAWPSLLGGLAGAVILIHTPEKAFRVLVPWLIIFACLLLVMQKPIARWVAVLGAGTPRHVPIGLWVAQLLISVYGGYFGAGIGILMLATMAIFLPSSLQHANSLKVLFAALINGIAAIYFIAVGAVCWPQALLMAATSVLGGLAGVALAKRMSAVVLRTVVVTYGLGIAGWLVWHG